MFCVALSCTHIFVCGLPGNLPNIVKCLVLSFSNAEMNVVLEVLTGERLWSQVYAALQCVLYLLMCRKEKVCDAVAELFRGK